MDGTREAEGAPLPPLEFDADGVPVSLSVDAWPSAFERHVGAGDGSGWARAILRFTRPDGSPVFGPAPSGSDERRSKPAVGRRLSIDDLPGEGAAATAPPSDARADRVLAILRAEWSKRSDFVAVDHRRPGPTSLVEVSGAGRRWLGPTWDATGEPTGGLELARPTAWSTGPSFDLAEWTFRRGATEVVRTVALLKGRRQALLAEAVVGATDGAGWSVDLDPGLVARPIADVEGVTLGGGPGRPSARALAIGLDRRSGRGSLEVRDGRLVLEDPQPSERSWLPLLVSWEPTRDRKPVRWYPLTVSEQSIACPADVAFAARVTWGSDDHLIIYRSLAAPALRSFLGHQTSARFLIGLFSKAGDVLPLVKLDA